MTELTIKVKIISECEEREVEDTFRFKHVKLEDIDENFVKAFISVTMMGEGDTNTLDELLVVDSDFYSAIHGELVYQNSIQACHDMLPSSIMDWEIVSYSIGILEEKKEYK